VLKQRLTVPHSGDRRISCVYSTIWLPLVPTSYPYFRHLSRRTTTTTLAKASKWLEQNSFIKLFISSDGAAAQPLLVSVVGRERNVHQAAWLVYNS
jgi:hypothetical protein